MAKKKKKKDKKSKSKNSDKRTLIESIEALHFLFEKSVDDAFDQYDLSNEQFKILQILDAGPKEGYPLKQIRKSLPNQTSNTTRLVEKLRLKGFLNKKTSKLDKRELRVSLTSSGSDVLKNASLKIQEINENLRSVIKLKELPDLLKSLTALEKALK